MEGTRRKWESSKIIKELPSRPKTNKTSTGPSQDYSDYLLKLQEKNRVMKKLKEKNTEMIEKERKEQGFTVYLNGENAKKRKSSNKAERPRKGPPSSDAKQEVYTGTHRRQVDLLDDFVSDDKEENDSKVDVSQRKEWSQGDVRIKTSSGKRLDLQAPERLTGDYDSDFETTLTESTMPLNNAKSNLSSCVFSSDAVSDDQDNEVSSEESDSGNEQLVEPPTGHHEGIMEFSSAPCLRSGVLLSHTKHGDGSRSANAASRPFTVGTPLRESTTHLRQNSAPVQGTRSLKSVSKRLTSLNDSLEFDARDLMEAMEEENSRLSLGQKSQQKEEFDLMLTYHPSTSIVYDGTSGTTDMLEETLKERDVLEETLKEKDLLEETLKGMDSLPSQLQNMCTTASLDITADEGEKVCGLRVLSSPPPGSTDVGVKKGGRPQVTNSSDKNMGRDDLLDNGDNEGSCSLDDSVLRRNHPQAVMDLASPFHSENQRSARTDSTGGGRTDSRGGGRTDSRGGGRTDSRGGGRTDSRGGGSIPDWLRTSTEKAFEDNVPGGQWYGSTSIATVFGDEKGPQSRPCSGRVSGLRGEMIRTSSADGRARPKKKEKAASTRQSSEEVPPMHEQHTEDPPFTSQSRVKTAVLAKGRRPIMLSSGSNPVLPPSVDDTLVSVLYESKRPDLVQAKPKPESRATQEGSGVVQSSSDISKESLSDPVECVSGPETSVKGRQTWNSIERRSIEECLASLSKFDSHHLGRISSDVQHDQRDEESNTEGGDSGENPQIEIPVLPVGKELVLNILSTWGDHYYVGLNGIEVFTATGERAPVIEIRADPSDINVLPDYDSDPRVVSNLLDGVNRTRDDLHMWLAPFTKRTNHFIYLTFQQKCVVAMIRIWNYNKSRIHSHRGARHVQMFLDGATIFDGEIAKSCGGLSGDLEEFGDTILFTTDDDILSKVAANDTAAQEDLQGYYDGCEEAEECLLHRPSTADHSQLEVAGDRPFTSANTTQTSQEKHFSMQESVIEEDETCVDSKPVIRDGCLFGQVLELNFTETWGDPYYLGLTGLEILGHAHCPISITADQLEGNPKDLTVLEGYEDDDRTLDKLVDGVTVTTSDEHMWLVPFSHGEDHLVVITLEKPVEITALRFWNYNKTPEDTFRGAKLVHVLLDGERVSPPDGLLMRKGPGNDHYDFGQTIHLIDRGEAPGGGRTGPDQGRSVGRVDLYKMNPNYDQSKVPRGFVYQIQLLSTNGDPYYVGLNGLELFSETGHPIPLTAQHIAAFPSSVNVLEGIHGDVRTPDKLIDGENDTVEGAHMWLAPLLPGIVTRVYIIFDTPVPVAMIKLWNYAKTPIRGVKEFAVLVDDLLVHTGIMGPVDGRSIGILPTLHTPVKPHSVFLSSSGNYSYQEGQDVQFTNDCKVMSMAKVAQRPVDQTKRPMTSLTGSVNRHGRTGQWPY